MKRPMKLGLPETLTQNKWFSVLEQNVLLPNGVQNPYYIVNFESTGVGIVVKDTNHYLLTYQYRFIIDTCCWGIPGGDFEKSIDQSLFDTARREMLEETGYEATSIEHLMFFYPSCGSTTQKYEIFLADKPEKTDRHFDQNEVLNVKWFHRDEIFRMIRDNQIVDAMALTPLMYELSISTKS